MSEACGVSYDVLAWTMEWYVREETLREANTVIVDHHYGLELAKVFGGGTMSSSDGQRFPVRGKALTGRTMVIHGGQVLSTYTHVSDQWSTCGTKIIVPTAWEAHLVLDDFLGNATDLPIAEHATDSHDGPLLGARWNEDLIAACWPDLLRMAGALKCGQATASLIVGKWSAASRQNTLAAALKEWGMLRRTITRPHLEQQTEQAWCLTLLTNSVVAWKTEYYSRAVLELRSQGREVSDEIAHLAWPQRQHHLLRRHQRGRRGGTGQARHQRMATASARPTAPAGADPVT
ncbi:Tn3 family transposase [Nonomuraea turcica]|uniref:Tn3 family transposase n=1 Tax=Nonomuraea sp. G32 TaxID=3067274 RepID=UPI00273A9AAD|nr:Tn3 family transposase [Nonomuraea sp. G32]MDP4510253.1 Tn3 family transposase [Nonomuraea sp. G32]